MRTFRASRTNIFSSSVRGLRQVLKDSKPKQIFWFLLLLGGFWVFTIMGSMSSNSMALWSFASLTMFDILSLAIYMLTVWISKQRPSPQYPFGYARMEVLALFTLCIIIILSAIFSTKECVERIFEPAEVDLSEVPLFAAVGFVLHVISSFFLNKLTTFNRGLSRTSGARPLPILSLLLGDRITEKNAQAVVGGLCGLVLVAETLMLR